VSAGVMRNPFLAVVPLLLVIHLAACRTSPNRGPVIGEAYAGPLTLNLRKDIPLQSPVVATAKHGERLEIVQHHRRFLKVRTTSGAEGWTEDYLLLTAAEMSGLKDVEKRARALPSQGVASTYDLLNVHTEPNRTSPSFLQIKAGEKFDVVAHIIAPRLPSERKVLIRPKPKTPPHKRSDSKYALPPPPPAPPLPANWLQLSKTPAEVLQEIAEEKAEHPVPTEDWSLVRNSKGESGWVLSSRVYMAIPDEVAQYAEGHRITSYFPLGDAIPDGDQVKHNWLWTTIAGGDRPYDFDSFRVFIWNLRRHRYETAYIQRNVRGYFPVRQQPVELTSSVKARGAPTTATYPGFSVCVENQDGVRVRRSFAFIVNIVRFAGERPCEPPGSILPNPGGPSQVALATGSAATTSLYGRLKNGLGALARKWFNR
jgi:Bacterial SH3 domain